MLSKAVRDRSAIVRPVVLYRGRGKAAPVGFAGGGESFYDETRCVNCDVVVVIIIIILITPGECRSG